MYYCSSWIGTSLPFTFFHFSLGFCVLSLFSPFLSFFLSFFLLIQLFFNSATTKPKIWIHLLILSSRYILDRTSIICTFITSIRIFCNTLYSVLTWWNSCFLLPYSAHFSFPFSASHIVLPGPSIVAFKLLIKLVETTLRVDERRVENYKMGSKIGKLPYTAPSPCILCTP